MAQLIHPQNACILNQNIEPKVAELPSGPELPASGFHDRLQDV